MTKPEIRMNDEIRMTDDEKEFSCKLVILVSSFVIHSDFGFRHSDFNYEHSFGTNR